MARHSLELIKVSPPRCRICGAFITLTPPYDCENTVSVGDVDVINACAPAVDDYQTVFTNPYTEDAAYRNFASVMNMTS